MMERLDRVWLFIFIGISARTYCLHPYDCLSPLTAQHFLKRDPQDVPPYEYLAQKELVPALYLSQHQFL